MRSKLLFAFLFFVLAMNGQGILTKKYGEKTLDYQDYFVVDRGEAPIGEKSNLSPMTDVGVCVPNGGIYKFFSGQTWKNEASSKFVNVFEEVADNGVPLQYMRFGWWKLEKSSGVYDFDQVVEPVLKKALQGQSRVIIGLASMCPESSGMSHVYQDKVLAIPDYLYEELRLSKYPPVRDETYVKNGFTVDYDSPLLLSRYKKLIKAFAKWLKQPITGTSVSRESVVYAIEMRYMGYWGEGSVVNKYYPKTDILDRYIDVYLDNFPQKLLIGAAQEMIHLPFYKGVRPSAYSSSELNAMNHVRKLLTSRNKFGRIGLFIDSWQPYSDMYDNVSKRVVMGEDGILHYLSDYLIDHVWGNVYLTGEFGYLIRDENRAMMPYLGLYQQFSSRHVSGISLHNVTASDRGKKVELADEVYARVRDCLSMIGYRIVLDRVRVEQSKDSRVLSFVLTNIGVSRMFHGYYEIHVIGKRDGGVEFDKVVPFDLRSLGYNTGRPLSYYVEDGTTVKTTIPSSFEGDLYLVVRDKEGIEKPMALSNYGRQSDGSYFLKSI